MLSRKFYDILFIIFLLSLVGGYFLNSFIDMGVNFDEPISKDNRLDTDAFMKGIALQGLLLNIPLGIFGIFIIILAIQMYKRDFIPMSDLIFIILFFALSIFWYPFVLRKHFKKVPSDTIVVQSATLTQ